jgi:hypothetical protein
VALKVVTAQGFSSSPVWVKVDGNIDLGLIDKDVAAAIRCTSGPIRLPQGFGGPKGHGLLHIEENERRIKEIRGLDYANATLFVVDVARNWTKIALANEANRLVLARSIPGYDLRLVVQSHRASSHCWSVVTAIPGRKLKPAEIMFERGKTAG